MARLEKAPSWDNCFAVDWTRHAQAGQAAVDAERQLNGNGVLQTEGAKRSYKETELASIRFAFCSPATRAQQTARRIVVRDVPVIIVPALMQFDTVLKDAFPKYHYDLQKYFDDEKVCNELKLLGADIRRKTMAALLKSQLWVPEAGDIIGLYGHYILQNYGAWACSTGFRDDSRLPADESILLYDFPEAGILRQYFNLSGNYLGYTHADERPFKPHPLEE